MRKESTESRSESRPEWEQLEDWVRSQVQRLIQELLEEEVTAFLGRAKSALRSDSDNDTGPVSLRSSPVREPAAAAVRQQDQEGC